MGEEECTLLRPLLASHQPLVRKGSFFTHLIYFFLKMRNKQKLRRTLSIKSISFLGIQLIQL